MNDLSITELKELQDSRYVELQNAVEHLGEGMCIKSFDAVMDSFNDLEDAVTNLRTVVEAIEDRELEQGALEAEERFNRL